MSFSEKCSAALRFLESKGISSTHYAPAAYRWLWRLGVPLPPPHFAGFFFNWFVLGSLFFLACYAASFIMWLTGVAGESSAFASLPYLVGYGLLFGLAMSAVYYLGARKHAIPGWSEFEPSAQADSKRTGQ